MNWQSGKIIVEAGRRLLIKNLTGADPHRIYEARTVQSRDKRNLELVLPYEDRVLRGRDMQGLMHVALAV